MKKGLFNISIKKVQSHFNFNRSWYKSIFVICSIMLFGILIISFNHNYLGPMSDYDWTYFTNDTNITKDNELIGTFSIEGIIRSKGIISPRNPADLMIFETRFNVKQEFLNGSLCTGGSCSNNTTAKVCLQGFNARGFNESESVYYTFERYEPACTENIIFEKSGDDDMTYITYSNTSQNINKKVVFITSGSQSLIIDNYIYNPIVIKNAFEVNPYYFYSELQLSKYAFLLALIGSIVVIIEIINFFGFNKYSIISALILIIVLIDLLWLS